MKITLTFLILGIFLIGVFGCAQRSYQPVTGKFTPTLEGQRISMSGVPAPPDPRDFAPATPVHKGHWRVRVNGVAFTEETNFENEPRIRAMRLMAETARRNNRKVKVAGKVSNGIVKLESFEGIQINTPWYKDKNPHYSYTKYYNWYPFAYEPNVQVVLDK